MERWKINLAVLWFGNFLVMGGMTMIIPFLSLYLQEMGIHDPHQVATWSGIIFAGNFVTSFLFQPLWGNLADRYGRKMMLLRSGFGMAVVMTLMGFAGSAWHLLLLRMLNGMISGFSPAAVSLMSTSAPKERMGFAMGTLQSGAVAGTILGPFIGGLLADWIGFRPIFYITGASLFVASVLAWIVVREQFDARSAAVVGGKRTKLTILRDFRELKQIPPLPALFTATLLIQFAMLSPQPLLPLFVQELHRNSANIALFAGLVGSVTGFSNMLAAPLLGKLGDRIGQDRVLGISLFGAAVAFIPQALVSHIWQLLAIRFVLGIFIGGLLPSINALIRKHTPEGMESRSFSFNTSALSLGNMLGPVIGGFISVWTGIQGVFVIGGVLLLINALWVRRSIVNGTGKAQAKS